MTTVKEKVAVPPFKISQIIHSAWSLRALIGAVELNLFKPLQDGPADVASVAGELDLDRRATEMLLDAMTGLELLEKKNGQYSLTEDSRLYLLDSSDLYLGKYVQMAEQIDVMWKGLAETVRTGKPQVAVNKEEKAAEFFPALTEAIFPLGYSTAQKVSDYLKVSQLPHGAKILDLAAGAATWSIPMAQDNASVSVDALDFPPILEVTKKFVQKYGMAERYGYIVGNWRNVPWQKDIYDIVILGHILHSEGAELSKQLLKRCFEAMKPGGHVVVAEFITNNERSSPAQAMVFGVNMLMHTEIGCVFSEDELTKMLAQAGFEKAELMPGQAQAMVITARKPG